jgi:hypothetical protein
MSMVYKYSRYDIATGRKPEKKWRKRMLICEECAKKVGIIRSFYASLHRDLPNEKFPCEICRGIEGLAEIEVSYENYQKIQERLCE